MFVLLVATLLTIDAQMTPQEKTQTGFSKLSGEEKGALQDWIDARFIKKGRSKKQRGPILQENLKNGHFIGLSDNSLWEINDSDTPITQGWISAVEIKCEHVGDGAYKLTNTLTGSTVRAKKATPE
ncbi:MAG TPA: hypothetical protein VLF94_00205 [Chlamydiales bacterium]|nr:hypothetical protein [Chlamydiales bacterium]